jgi:Replication-relaxation
MKTILTNRDVAVLVDVYTFRYLSAAQVEALHFPSQRTAYRRLQTLRDGKYLKAFTVQGVSGRIFHLATYGAAVVAQFMQVDIDDLQWNREMRAPKDYYFLRHFMAINDFRIALTLACQKTSISLLGFIPEYIGEKTDKGNVKKYLRDNVNDISNSLKQISHTPDAAFALEKDGNAALFFVEIDRGVETVSDPQKGVLKSIVFYLNYFVAGKFNRYEQDFNREFKTFRSLLVTNSPKRLQNIRKAATTYQFPKQQAKRFLWGATDIDKNTIFSPVWQSLDANDETRYKIG